MSTYTAIAANGTTALNNAGAGSVSTKTVSLVSTSFSGSIAVSGRITGTSDAYVPIPYRKRYLNGAVGDDTFVSTAITGTSLIEVNAAGLDIALVTTGYASGSMAVKDADLIG